MAIVKPASLRSRIDNKSSGIEVIIPAKRNFFIMIFLPAWLVGWAVGEYFAINQILYGNAPGGVDLFVLAWLTMWTIGGGFALLVWLWSLNGRERIVLDTTYLTIKHELFGKGRSRQYELSHIRNIRVSATGFNPMDFRSGLQFWGIGGGLIAFDYGADTVRFGASLSESEAGTIIEKLKEKHSFV